jgi:hypothetical protein
LVYVVTDDVVYDFGLADLRRAHHHNNFDTRITGGIHHAALEFCTRS